MARKLLSYEEMMARKIGYPLSTQKKCNDCGDDLGLKFKIYGDRRYCEECYLNVREKCSICGNVEKDKREFFPAKIEEDDMKSVVICLQCASKLHVCSQVGCSIYFKKSDDKKCENCDLQYCKMHRLEHTCKSGEPAHLFRKVSSDYFVGNAKLAKEIKIPWLVGIELEAVNGNPDILHNRLERKVGISHDGSLQGRQPIEMQLPPSSNDKLEKTIKHVTKVAKNAGYKVNKTCGAHIHLDAIKYRQDGQFIFRLLSTYYAIEPVIFAMLPKSRRNNKYALPLRSWIGEAQMLEMTRKPVPNIDQLQVMWYKCRGLDDARGSRVNKYDSSRYHGFNLHCLFTIGTVEMRYFNGTLNANKLINWTNFHLTIFDWVLNRFNQNVVDAIFFAENVDDKFRLMNRHMKFSKVVRRFTRKRIAKFADNDGEDI